MYRNSLSIQKKARSWWALAVAVPMAFAASGCDDPFGLQATTSTRADTLVAFAMTGTPPTFPSAYNAGTGSVVRVGPEVGFDVAFDLEGTDRVRVIPARLISQVKQGFGGGVPTHQVSLQVVSGTYESVTRAPDRGFKIDSTVTVARGETVVMEVLSEACQFSLASTLYAKLVVDSLDTASRRIHFRTVRNPNCGFRSFLPGVPKN